MNFHDYYTLFGVTFHKSSGATTNSSNISELVSLVY